MSSHFWWSWQYVRITVASKKSNCRLCFGGKFFIFLDTVESGSFKLCIIITFAEASYGLLIHTRFCTISFLVCFYLSHICPCWTWVIWAFACLFKSGHNDEANMLFWLFRFYLMEVSFVLAVFGASHIQVNDNVSTASYTEWQWRWGKCLHVLAPVWSAVSW